MRKEKLAHTMQFPPAIEQPNVYPLSLAPAHEKAGGNLGCLAPRGLGPETALGYVRCG